MDMGEANQGACTRTEGFRRVAIVVKCGGCGLGAIMAEQGDQRLTVRVLMHVSDGRESEQNLVAFWVVAAVRGLLRVGW